MPMGQRAMLVVDGNILLPELANLVWGQLILVAIAAQRVQVVKILTTTVRVVNAPMEISTRPARRVATLEIGGRLLFKQMCNVLHAISTLVSALTAV